MALIEISHLTKTYKTSKRTTNVLNDVSFSLPSSGLIVLLGKSGSGKSTLLNIIGGIDKPSKGSVVFSRHSDSSGHDPYKKRKPISFIFQHYHLLENETPLYNIMLPALIQGMNKKTAEEQARELTKLFNIEEGILKKETKFLSGGEKERIAILRALITNPQVILADEPTGALDSGNAIKTMDILKKASKTKLVLLVTHNKNLANQYADRIITLSDGKITNDETINSENEEPHYSKVNPHYKNDWTSTIINHNFKKRLKRNVVSMLGLTISLCFCYLLFGFSTKSESAIQEISKKHFDYGSGVINKEIRTVANENSISLVRTLKPDLKDIDEIQNKFPEFEIMPNYDAVFNSGTLYLGNAECNEIHSAFVLNFEPTSINSSLIINGKIPPNLAWNDVIINKKAYEFLNNDISKINLHYKVIKENKYSISREEKIVDYFEIEEKLNVICVVDEFDFLATPKIYFNYSEIDSLLEDYLLENLSEYKSENISWKDKVVNAAVGDELSSYSVRCFLKDYRYSDKVEELNEYLNNEIKLENDSLAIKEALFSLTTAAGVGLDIFLVISLIGSVLILGVFSFSAYNDDKMESSILSCLGARNYEIVSIFTSESLIVVFLSFLLSTVLSTFIQNPLCLLLEKLVFIPNLIQIPFKSFLGIRGLLPISIFSIMTLVTLLFTSLPILVTKSISIKKELSDL